MRKIETLRTLAWLVVGLALVSRGAGSEKIEYPLLDAAERGDIERVKTLLSQGQDIGQNHYGITALHVAARVGHKELVEFLLSRGANVGFTKYGKITPLFCAVMNGRNSDIFPIKLLPPSGLSRQRMQASDTRKSFSDIVALLIEHGAGVNAIEHECGFVLLQYAVLGGSTDIVKTLLDHGARVNPEPRVVELRWQTYGGPLHLAARTGDLPMCELLLGCGADVNAKTPVWVSGSEDGGQTPLHHAVRFGRTKIVELLINHGAAVSATSRHAQTPLHVVTEDTERSIAELLLSRGVDVNAVDSEGRTALHCAATYATASLADALLSHGAKVNAIDGDARTPLHHAAERKDQTIVESLLSHGAHTDCKDSAGQTPTSIAVQKGSGDIVRLLSARHGRVTIHSAASIGDANAIERLVKDGVRVNRLDLQGRTALHAAVAAGQVRAVEWLLAHGANVNLPDDKEATALSLALGIARRYYDSRDPNEVARFTAMKNKERDIIACLIRHGAAPDFSYGIPQETVLSHAAKVADLLIDVGFDLEPFTDRQATLLHRAAWSGRTEAVRDLLELGADVNATDRVGGTSLHAAVQAGCSAYGDVFTGPQMGVLQLLIAHAANVNATNDSRATPLHGAAIYGHTEALKLLLDHGAQVNAVDSRGRTPLHAAAIRGSAAAMKLLIARGADPNARDDSGRTPQQLLQENPRVRTIEPRPGKGTDPNTPAAERWIPGWRSLSPISQAQAKRELKTVEALAPKAPAALLTTVLFQEVEDGYSELIPVLVAHGADGNAHESLRQETPLHRAVNKRNLKAIELLVDHGADVDSKDKNNETPLGAAVYRGQKETVALLLSRGADVNVAYTNPYDLKGGIPLHVALRFDHLDIARMLVLKGSDVNRAGTGEGLTPLHLALKDRALFELMLEQGGQINSPSTDGTTCLHLAAQAGQDDLVQYLITNGATVNVQDRSGNTPLHLAAKTGRRTTCEILIAQKAGLNLRNKKGLLPLDYAQASGVEDVFTGGHATLEPKG